MASPPPKIDDSAQAGNYAELGGSSSWETDFGLLVLPCADGTPVVIQTHTAYGVRRRSFTGRKAGSPAVSPTWRDDEIVLDAGFEFAAPRPLGSTPPTWDFQTAGYFSVLEPVPSLPSGGYGSVSGSYYPMSLPDIEAQRLALAAGAIVGGPALGAPLTPDFTTGNYSWPWEYVSAAFFDPNLS